MCTEVEIRRPGMRSLYVSTVRELARHLHTIVDADYRGRPKSERRTNRMAEHCLCPIDIRESAKRSGFTVVDEPGFCPDIVIQKVSAPAKTATRRNRSASR